MEKLLSPNSDARLKLFPLYTTQHKTYFFDLQTNITGEILFIGVKGESFFLGTKVPQWRLGAELQ